MKPLWQNVEQKAPDELVGAERHCAVPRLSAAAVILVAEGHAARIESKEATVRDGDAMGVAGEIGQHRLRPGEGWFGVDEPFLPLERCQMCGKDLAAMQVLDLAKEREPACRVGVGERRQEQPPEQAGKHLHRQEKAGLAAHPACPVERYPATRHNHMTCGWWVIVEPQLWSTAVAPMRAPRCLGSAAIVSSVSAAVRNN